MKQVQTWELKNVKSFIKFHFDEVEDLIKSTNEEIAFTRQQISRLEVEQVWAKENPHYDTHGEGEIVDPTHEHARLVMKRLESARQGKMSLDAELEEYQYIKLVITGALAGIKRRRPKAYPILIDRYERHIPYTEMMGFSDSDTPRKCVDAVLRAMTPYLCNKLTPRRLPFCYHSYPDKFQMPPIRVPVHSPVLTSEPVLI